MEKEAETKVFKSKEDPNDESFGFFIVRVNVGLLHIIASSCRLKGKAKNPAESEALHGNQQRCPKQSILAHLSNFFTKRYVNYVKKVYFHFYKNHFNGTIEKL